MSEFTCARCGETFISGWTDEEALAELEREFPGAKVENCCVVCDDCFDGLQTWRARLTPAEEATLREQSQR